MQRDGLSVPVSGAGGEICRCCIWDVQHGSHQAPFPPFKQIKTSLQHSCASPELLRMPVLKGCRSLWNGLSPLCTKRRPGFLHIIFSCCDRTTSALWAVEEEGWHKVVVWGTGLCSLLAVARWGGCSTFLIQQCVESRITARENSKGRIKHTVCSSACVVLSLQDGWRVLYKQHHRSLCLLNFRLCQSAPLFVLQLLLKGMVVFTCNIKYIFFLSS